MNNRWLLSLEMCDNALKSFSIKQGLKSMLLAVIKRINVSRSKLKGWWLLGSMALCLGHSFSVWAEDSANSVVPEVTKSSDAGPAAQKKEGKKAVASQKKKDGQVVVPEITAEQSVKEVISQLFVIADKHRESFQEAPLAFYDDVRSILEPALAFKMFARRIMSKHYSKASPEQRRRFVDISKQTLLQTYAKGLLEIGKYKVEVLPPKAGVKASLRNTKVTLQVETPGRNRIQIIQSMYYSRKMKRWKVQNVMIAGINIGLILRENFARLVRQSGGDMDKAITNWSKELTTMR